MKWKLHWPAFDLTLLAISVVTIIFVLGHVAFNVVTAAEPLSDVPSCTLKDIRGVSPGENHSTALEKLFDFKEPKSAKVHTWGSIVGVELGYSENYSFYGVFGPNGEFMGAAHVLYGADLAVMKDKTEAFLKPCGPPTVTTGKDGAVIRVWNGAFIKFTEVAVIDAAGKTIYQLSMKYISTAPSKSA